MTQRLEAEGEKNPQTQYNWDDGSDHDGVTKIYVRGDREGIQFIKFGYVGTGQLIDESFHGFSNQCFTQMFEINHADNEYLLSIDGYYNETSGVIQALQFKTNMKTSEMMGGKDDDDDDDGETGTKFSLGCNGHKIIGFHGYAEKTLYSLGAYFTSLPITKLEYKDSAKRELYDNGNSGYLWDDGTFQGVRKVYVYYDGLYIRCVRFEYDNGGKVESREHGVKALSDVQEREFVLDYPNESLMSVKGTSTRVYIEGDRTVITSLSFKTSKGRTSPTFGNEFCRSPVEFELEKKGCAIVGFHGRSAYYALHALGAYFSPVPHAQ
ncbi:PREDICTED: jacalin-related lectin 13-like [Camelina sativa]|uniref:Jacalin-related lectin 13-like n=1 Tax=Camelina sativa TaxID=90675 RepID=A0ABM0ZG09_CAMSA|nr:PREDICTED: jacalin-related lectin 13-like [Camelina sativa]